VRNVFVGILLFIAVGLAYVFVLGFLQR